MINLPNRLGFLGCGNMGGAILDGILNSKILPASRITVLEKPDSLESFRKRGINLAEDFQGLLNKTDMILLCVKPQTFPELSESFQSFQGEIKVLVSIMAGLSVVKIQNLVGPSFQIIRTMPNLPLSVKEGMTAIVKNSNFEHQIEQVEGLFSCCGKVVQVFEEHMDVVTALSGSGPAFVFQYLESQIQAGIKEGLDLGTVKALVEQTLLGSVKVVQKNSFTLSEWISKVCSKGGTTVAGLSAMEELGFSKAVEKGIEVATQCSRDM